MNLVELNNTYKSKWVDDFKNESNEQLENLWQDIFEIFDDVSNRNAIRRRGITDVPSHRKKQRTVVVCSTMGSGKSTTLQHYLLNADNIIQGWYKALIIVERIETCNEYEGILKQRGAVAVHSENDNTLEDCLNSRILIITHNRLTQLLNQGASDELFNQYDLVAIDEQINSYQHVSFTYKQLKGKILPLIEVYELLDSKHSKELNKVVVALDKFKEENRDKNANEIYDRYTDDITNILNWNSIADCLEESLSIKKRDFEDKGDIKIIKNFIASIRILSKQGRMKLCFFHQDKKSVTVNVVIDFLPAHISKVIFDGTAKINDTYKLLNQHIGNNTVEIKHYKNLRTFSNTSIKYFPIATGKSKLTITKDKNIDPKGYAKQVSDVKATLKEFVDEVVRRYGKQEKVLLIVHKDNIGILEQLIENTNYQTTYWGKHVGLNDWKDCKKVVILGLNYMPETAYYSHFYSTFSCRTNLDVAPMDDLKASLLASDILQAMFRGQLRLVGKYGLCLEGTEVIISMPKEKKMRDNILNRIQTIVPDANYEEIHFIDRVDTESKNTQKLNTIVNCLKETNKDCVVSKDVKSSTGINSLRDMFTRGQQVTKNNRVLRDEGYVFRYLYDGDYDNYNISRNNKQAFIKVQPFDYF